jgi:RNA polymerase primary sigma factor
MRPAHTPRDSPSSSDELLTNYLQEIGAYPLLSAADEFLVAKRAREGDENARNQLICANLRFVVSVAKRYHHRGLPLADLVDEGNLGLLRAASRFDERKGVRFISYAVWWVRQAILAALAGHAGIVRLPLSRAATLRSVRQHANRLRNSLGREPTRRELLDGTQFTENDVIAIAPNAGRALSLDLALASGDGSLNEYLSDSDAPRTDDEAIDGAQQTVLHEALDHLRGREARVLRMYFGLDGLEPKTLEEIGSRFGITRERARQIKEKALARLRKSRDAHLLVTYYRNDSR